MFIPQCRSKLGLKFAADVDVENEQSRHHESRNHSGQPELPHRLAGNHRVKHQNHRGRDQNSKRGSRLDHPCDHPFIIIPSKQFRQRDRCSDGHSCYRKPVHRGNQNHQTDCSNRQPPIDRPHPDMEHAVKIISEFGLRENISHEDEHRQCQKRIPFHQFHRG